MNVIFFLYLSLYAFTCLYIKGSVVEKLPSYGVSAPPHHISPHLTKPHHNITTSPSRLQGDFSWQAQIWWSWNDVGGVTFGRTAQHLAGDVGVSLFVSGAAFGEILEDSWSAKCCTSQCKMCLQSEKITSANGPVRDEQFMFGSFHFKSCSHHGRIGRHLKWRFMQFASQIVVWLLVAGTNFVKLEWCWGVTFRSRLSIWWCWSVAFRGRRSMWWNFGRYWVGVLTRLGGQISSQV